MNEEQINELQNIFFPTLFERRKKIKDAGTNLVHYTSAEAAFKIISGAEFWMRDSSCLNDFREITHGWDCLAKALDAKGCLLKKILDQISASLFEKVISNFDSRYPIIEHQTFIGSFSEHDEGETFGRLSMWRAYGGDNPVALILNNDAFFGDHDEFNGLYVNSVDYHSLTKNGADETLEKLNRIAKNIENNSDFLKKFDEEVVTRLLGYVFLFIITGTKHKGFQEEKEWRTIYCPMLEKTELAYEEFEIIGNMPQKVCKIPLKNYPEHGINNLGVPDFINRVIIGPTRNWRIIYKSLLEVMNNAGIENAHEKITISDIPLRT